MTPFVLIGVLALAYLASQDKKKPSTRKPGKEIPTGPGAEHFESLAGGVLAYKPDSATALIQALLYRYVVATEQTNVLMVLPGEGQPIALEQGGAYYGLQAVHDEGYVIWVPTTFHWPQSAQGPVFVVALPPGEPPPTEPPYAVLILPDEPWPPLGVQKAA